MLDAVFLLFRLFPKNLLSWTAGCVARISWPGFLARAMAAAFAKIFGLNMAEAELPITAYRSVEDLFTRRLKPGLRPLAAPVGSPADGYLARSAPAEAGRAIQAKGLDYALDELCFGKEPVPKGFDAAWFTTIYLAPHNYHRVHAPFSGVCTAVRYLPGELWPVNVPSVLRVARLFSRNERLVFDFDLASGGKAWAVMVGAFNVGRMTTPLVPDLVTNALSRQLGATPSTRPVGRPVAQGDELGTFLLGSTVVLVYDRAALAGLGPKGLLRAEGNRPILMGQTLMA